jgi:O-antigen/teichoic acid export membrane protein
MRVSRSLRRLMGAYAVHLVCLVGLQAGLGFVFAVLSARWLGPVDRGVIVVVSTLGGLLMLVGSLGVATGGRALLSQTSPRFGLHESVRVQRLLVLGHVVTASVVGIPVFVLSTGRVDAGLFVVFVCYALGLLGAYLGRETLHGLGHHRSATSADVAMVSVLVVGILVLHIRGADSMVNVAKLMAVAVGLEALALYLAMGYVTRGHSRAADPLSASAVVRLSLPALAAVIGQAFVIRGDRLILGWLVDSRLVGLYGTAATLTEVLTLVPQAMAQITFQRSAAGEQARTQRVERRSLVVSAAAAVALAALAAPLVEVTLGAQYAEAVPMVWGLCLPAVVLGMFLTRAAVLNGAGEFGGPALATSVGSVILFLGCLIGIPRWGAYGAIGASALAYSAMVFLATYRIRRLPRAVNSE